MKNEFVKTFNEACQHRSRWEVWFDWVEMCAIGISNAVDQQRATEREAQYVRIAQKYTSDELQRFPEMLAYMALCLDENPDQDFLGELYMILELNDKTHSQFFTPYNTCRLVVDLVRTGDAWAREIEHKGWVAVSDPACGAGALLIAARNALARAGYGSDHVWFAGQELMHSTALMSYLQLSLLGCAGVIVIGDTLHHPMVAGDGGLPLWETEGQDLWILPGTYRGAWPGRIRARKMEAYMRMLKA